MCQTFSANQQVLSVNGGGPVASRRKREREFADIRRSRLWAEPSDDVAHAAVHSKRYSAERERTPWPAVKSFDSAWSNNRRHLRAGLRETGVSELVKSVTGVSMDGTSRVRVPLDVPIPIRFLTPQHNICATV